MIETRNLTRVFRTYKKAPGFWGGVKGLVRREYEEIEAAKDININIAEGEFVGFLGPNGAGKTTVLKMLAGLIYPTSGSSRVSGFDPTKRQNEYRRIFALVLGQKNQLWWDLPAAESFNLLRHIYAVPKNDFQEKLETLTDLLRVVDKLNVPVRELSLGERMKMELIGALLHSPRILFLDEPTIGLDVLSQRTIRAFLKDYNQRFKVTILLTSHYMADIEELCKRVIIIHKGQKLYDGQLDLLNYAEARHKIIRIRPTKEITDGEKSQIPHPMERIGSDYILRVPNDEAVATCQRMLGLVELEDITIEDVPLEDIIHKLYEDGSLNEGDQKTVLHNA